MENVFVKLLSTVMLFGALAFAQSGDAKHKMRCGCGGQVSGRRLPLGAGGSAFFDEDDSRKFLFSRAEGRFLRGSDVLAELEHLDPPVVRVANIEAVGPINP